jgi:hypothetical protein
MMSFLIKTCKETSDHPFKGSFNKKSFDHLPYFVIIINLISNLKLNSDKFENNQIYCNCQPFIWNSCNKRVEPHGIINKNSSSYVINATWFSDPSGESFKNFLKNFLIMFGLPSYSVTCFINKLYLSNN